MFDPNTGQPYEPAFLQISDFLGVKLNTRKQKQSGRVYYLISMSSVKSKKIGVFRKISAIIIQILRL